MQNLRVVVQGRNSSQSDAYQWMRNGSLAEEKQGGTITVMYSRDTRVPQPALVVAKRKRVSEPTGSLLRRINKTGW